MTYVVKLAGMLLLGVTLGAHARAEQPRVFFAPDERSMLTARRLYAVQHGLSAVALMPAATVGGAEGAAAAEGEASKAAARRPARLDGISLARDGHAAAWIGGRRYDDGARLAGYRLRISREGVHLIGSQGEGRLLKVGQIVGGVWVAAEKAP
jgi:hypothetical protein